MLLNETKPNLFRNPLPLTKLPSVKEKMFVYEKGMGRYSSHSNEYLLHVKHNFFPATHSVVPKDLKKEMNFILDIVTFIFQRSTASQLSHKINKVSLL